MQKKEHTIDSQILALKKQIAEAGDILIKEYIDDGYSGARLDRPALSQLRKDLKSNLFETIYFHNTDRIARDVTFQNIIISEILKHRKQIIINGKDYVHNPENKFTLTVLGAVAELERAKIMERVSRGKKMKLDQGLLVGCGCGAYGYDYIHKTPTSAPKMVINEKEAKIVRFMFTEYAKDRVGMNQITRKLEEMGIKTKAKKYIWRRTLLKNMLRNHTYCGIKYYNQTKRVREYANPLFNVSNSSSKIIKRDKKDWIAIKVPAIVEQKLFDKVQERLAWNRQHYRNPKRTHLLSSLIRCGHCGSSFYGYRRHYTVERKTKPSYIFHRVAYKCNWRLRQNDHIKSAPINRCVSSEISAPVMEAKVFGIIEKNMLDPENLKKHMDFFKSKGRNAQIKMEQKLKNLEQKIQDLTEEKKRIIDIYASGDIAKEEYIRRNLGYDNEINMMKIERVEMIKRIPLLNKTEVLEYSIAQYCDAARIRYKKCSDFQTKRQFLLDYVEHVTNWNYKITVHGSVPVQAGKTNKDGDQTAESEMGKIEFSIEG